MATWSRVSAGAFRYQFTSSGTPNDPGGYQAGDLLLCFCVVSATQTLQIPSGWTRLSSTSVTGNAQIIGIIASSGSETMPSIVWGGDNRNQLNGIVVYRCGTIPSPPSSLVTATAGRFSTSVTDIQNTLSSVTVPDDGSLFITWGARNNTGSASTFTAINAQTNFTKVVEYQPPSSGSISGIVAEWIQTTKTNTSTSLVYSGSFNDGSQSIWGNIIVLKPGQDVTPGNIGPTPWANQGGMGSILVQ
jgi:hypothetical protein